MAWPRRDPRDVDEQLLEYATNGRLVTLPTEGGRPRSRRNPLTLFIVVAATVSAAFGALIAVVAESQAAPPALIVGAAVTGIAGIVVLVAAGGAIHERASERTEIRPAPGAVLPPDLLHAGNWIHRGGAWVRIEEIGRDGGGRVTALLSTGEVVILDAPVTIAGGRFRPAVDPLESLRR